MSLERRHVPDANRLSVLLAVVLLSYALAQLIERQQYAINIQLLDIDYSFLFELTSLAILLAAGLTASGVNWLLQSHPQYTGQNTLPYWILPALTALVLGVPLYNLSPGLLWWLAFSLGGIFLLLVLVAEYIALDSSDVRHPAASAGLMALSFALFVVLASTLSHSGLRLAAILLVIFPASGMVTLRAIHLQTGSWDILWALTSAFVLTQLAAAFHYWPLTPIQYGLALLGPLYALTGLTVNLREAVPLRRAGVDALLGLAVFWVAAIFLGD